MSKIVITTRVTLEFLGEEYASGHVIFNSIPLRELDELEAQRKKVESSTNKSADFVKDIVIERFVSGEIPQGGKPVKIEKDDLLDFPVDFFIQAMSRLTGNVSPK